MLRTVLHFATAHAVCASRDGSRKSGFLTAIPAKIGIFFCAIYNYARKADFGKGFWNPKRKFGVTMYLSEIITLQCHTLLCISALFRIIAALLSLSKKKKKKKKGVVKVIPNFIIWIQVALAKIYVFRI